MQPSGGATTSRERGVGCLDAIWNRYQDQNRPKPTRFFLAQQTSSLTHTLTHTNTYKTTHCHTGVCHISGLLSGQKAQRPKDQDITHKLCAVTPFSVSCVYVDPHITPPLSETHPPSITFTHHFMHTHTQTHQPYITTTPPSHTHT